MLLYLYYKNGDNSNMPTFLLLIVKLNHLEFLKDVKCEYAVRILSNCGIMYLLLCLLESLGMC